MPNTKLISITITSTLTIPKFSGFAEIWGQADMLGTITAGKGTPIEAKEGDRGK